MTTITRVSHRNPVLSAWLFIANIAAVTVVLWAFVDKSFEISADLSWWFVALLVFAFESLVIHLEFRKDAHSFSMGEIATVIALFGASPHEMLVGVVIGSFAALLFSRRQTSIKLAFNVSQYALTAGVVIVVFRTLVNTGDILAPSNLGVVLLATVAGVMVSEATIVSIIRLTGGAMAPKDVFETMALGVFGALLNGTLGFLFVLLAVTNPRLVWIGAVPPAIMFLAYRNHASQRNQTERLQSMHAVTESIHTAAIVEDAMSAATSSARELVDASWVEILVVTDRIALEALRTYDDGERNSVMLPTVLKPHTVTWWDQVVNARESVIAKRGSSATALAPDIDKDLVVVPIVGAEDAFHGYLLAADRLGDVSTFGDADRRLLETVAKQVSVAVDNGMLETSLAAVTELKERLEEMVQSKDQFIASVSHELRTPLTAVLGLSRELETNMAAFDPDDVNEFVHMISDQATELSYIIEDLLVAARADIGTLAVRPEKVDLGEMVQNLTAPSLKFAGSTQIQIIGEAPEAFADGVRFRQVFRNLLTNAKRYGGDEVTVEMGTRGSKVLVAVVDNGPGVPADRADAIFQPYERAHSEPTQPGSVGLGLAVARQLTRMMGGDLSYTRIAGLTRFEISLPRFVDRPSGLHPTSQVTRTRSHKEPAR